MTCSVLAVLEIRRILFPVDFSEQTDITSPFVNALASHFGAQVTLLRVVPPPQGLSSESGELALFDPGTLLHDVEPHLDGAIHREFAGLHVERVLEFGDPAEMIARFAYTQGADLIMMPTHGCGPLRHLLLGSVTAKVVHDAPCPVWTSVHAEEFRPSANTTWHTVLCAVDQTESTPAIKWASQFAEKVGATLQLVHVIPWSEHWWQTQPSLDWQSKLQQEALQHIERLQRHAGVKAQTTVKTGPIARGVCDEARKQQADLLVIGRGLARDTAGRFGKHGYEILRIAPCPVISV